MNVGEAATSAIISNRHDPDCYFCNSDKPPLDETNDLDDEDVDGMESEGIRHKNSSSKLKTALVAAAGAADKPEDKEFTLKGNDFASRVAAHHCIPGEGSMTPSTIMKYLHVHGTAPGNIGYNINSAPNGVWLPGSYAISGWGKKGAGFQATYAMDPKLYAFKSIDTWQAQFHDAHKDYNTFLLDALDAIAEKLKLGKKVWCPKAKAEDDDPKKRSPLYVLVNRLHTVSARMRRMLVFPTKPWKKNIFTSALSLKYIREKPHRG